MNPPRWSAAGPVTKTITGTALMGLLLVCLVGLALAAAPVAWAGAGSELRVGDYSISDPSKVYVGNHRLFQRPATVSCDRVYDRIPEYQEIVRKGLTEKDPNYHILMKKASKRFSDAVKKMARAKRHDLVACAGAIKKDRKEAPDIPDRTSEVIKALD